MSLRIVAGKSRADKSEFILNEMKQALMSEPIGKPIFYIVPEQMTFQLENELLLDEEISGSMRAEVVSFSRLAFRVLQETGGSTKQFITSTGMQMILRKIINEKTDPFLMFQKAVEKTGFIEQLEGIMTEFKRHRITPDLLKEHIDYAQDQTGLHHKLTDLHYIYAKLEEQMKGKYIDGEDRLRLLGEKVSQTALFRDAHIYIDGFYRFTPNELHIIEQLLQVSECVSIALTTDEEQLLLEQSELDLFFQTTETYQTLTELVRQLDLKIDDTVMIKNEANNRKDAVFNHLENHFDDRPTPEYTGEVVNEIQVKEAIHPRAEMDRIVQEILKLTRDEGYRYNDIVIYSRDSDTYHDLIRTVFNDYQIPVFIDDKRTMLNHPLVEFIRSFLDLVETNWRYDAMFRLLKSGFHLKNDDHDALDLDGIDRLENYALEYGIRSKSDWVSEEPWRYRRLRGLEIGEQTDKERRIEKEINAYRKIIVDVFLPFDEAIRQKDSVVERATIIYQLLESIRVPEQLEEQMNLYEEEGQIEKSREEEQVWNGIVQVLDEMVEMIGGENVSFKVFREVMETGLSALEYSHVPPTLDHIIVATIDRSRIRKKKVAFLIGVNEGVWPLKPAIDGMINENEREYLKQFGLRLAESNRRVLLDDLFYMYLAFTTPSEKLYVSYPISDQEGKGKMPSSMIARLYELFPKLEKPELLQDPDDLYDAERFITTPLQTRAPLTAQLARYMRGYGMEDVWWSVLDWYMKHEQKHSPTYKVLSSIYYTNKPVHLSKQVVNELYKKKINMSVSRLEMHQSCSYKHFAQYSLGLEERKTYALEAPDIGSLFHEALKVITDWIKEEGKDFSQVTKEESKHYAQRSMETLAPILQHRILTSSNRYKYIKRKLQAIIERATFILSEQARASGFETVGVELAFDYGETLEPVTIPLANGYDVILRGRIDRVDQARINDQLYLRIIDYKSSSRELDLVEVYYGLALQMLTYLQVILNQSEAWLGEQADPAGVLYFHVHNPIIKDGYGYTNEKIEEEILKQFKLRGLIVKRPDVAQEMDLTHESGYSQIAPFALGKQGNFYSNVKSVVEEETFNQLGKHMFRIIEQAGLSLTSGEVKLNPYEYKEMTACTFCDFRSVCQFDRHLRDNQFRQLSPLDQDDIYAKLSQYDEGK